MVTEQLSNIELHAILVDLVPELKAKRVRLKGVVEHIKMSKKTFAPRGQTPEHRYLDSLTHTPWGVKIAKTFSQELNVSGFRTPTSDPTVNDPAWELWDEARMEIMQDILMREAFQYGESFCAALTSGPGTSYAKPLPPMHTIADFEDPVTDVWPESVLSTTADRNRSKSVDGTLYVKDWVYPIDFPDGLDADTARFGDPWQHNSENTPVIRFFDELDSEGNATGKIEPVLAILERIRKDTYDRQMIQHKHSWRVRTATGLEPDPDSAETPEQAKLRLGVEDILVSSDPNVKFGTLDVSPMGDLIAGKEADVFELCSIAQIPPSAVMPGKVSNISAETIAELRSSFENCVADHKSILGESFKWLIRALTIQAGQKVELKARCQWEDRSSRSLAQAMDAWSKGVPGLEIPVEGAWEHLPGITAAETLRWANLNKRKQGAKTVADIFAAAQPPVAPVVPGAPQAPAAPASPIPQPPAAAKVPAA